MCVGVCICVWVYAYVRVWVYVFVCGCMPMYVCGCMYLCVGVCLCTCVGVCICVWVYAYVRESVRSECRSNKTLYAPVTLRPLPADYLPQFIDMPVSTVTGELATT